MIINSNQWSRNTSNMYILSKAFLNIPKIRIFGSQTHLCTIWQPWLPRPVDTHTTMIFLLWDTNFGFHDHVVVCQQNIYFYIRYLYIRFLKPPPYTLAGFDIRIHGSVIRKEVSFLTCPQGWSWPVGLFVFTPWVKAPPQGPKFLPSGANWASGDIDQNNAVLCERWSCNDCCILTKVLKSITQSDLFRL
jgi:hypothetical protein